MKSRTTVRVLESFAEPRPTTNPYIVQLARALEQEPGCEVLTFSFNRALFAPYDVFHVHWPEVIYAGNRGLKGVARELLFAAVLARLQLSGKPVVRTRHNIAPHESLSRSQLLLEGWLERLTRVTITLNSSTDHGPDMPASTILHGHYRDWFAGIAVNEPTPGRITFFGLIRRYKGVETLLESFLKTELAGLTLSISGKAATEEISHNLLEMAQGDDRVEFDFRYLSDAELVASVTQAELVVLPYCAMHNSGAAMAALSLNRPVLLPDTPVNRLLQEEAGPGWVYLFRNELTAAAVEGTLMRLREHSPRTAPDLSARSWQSTGAEHLRVFENALDHQAKHGAGIHSRLAVNSDVG